MAAKVIRYASREEWLAGRSQGIGASEAASVVGLNPFETPYQLWRRKKGLDPPPPETFAMRAGHLLEDDVAQLFAEATGSRIIQATTADFAVIDEARPWLRVSPDRLFWRQGARRNAANKAVLECKTTQRDIDPDDLPSHWFCQLQMNMGVAGCKDGALAWLTAGREFGFMDFSFNPAFFDWIAAEVTKFWQDCIIGGQEPPATDVQDVLLKHPRHDDAKTAIATDETEAAWRRLKELKEELAAMEAKKKELEAEIKTAMGEAGILADPRTGQTLATWKAAKDGKKFNEKRFAQEHPQLHAQYLENVAGTRRFMLK